MREENAVALSGYKRRLIKAGIAAAAVIAVVLAIFIRGYSNAAKRYENVIQELKEENKELEKELNDVIATYTNATKEVTLDLIQAQIKDIGELATVEYLYTDAGKFEDSAKLFGKEVPFSTKSFIAKWDGIIKAGIKIDEVVVDILKEEKKIVIHMPKAEILSHEVDAQSVETLDEKDGLFNPVTVEDVRKFDVSSKEAMEKRAAENGILDKAFENAKRIIERLVNNETVQEQEYTIVFEVIE